MPFPYDRYPWLNFQELNLAYFIRHFQEIFEQWTQLLADNEAWKTATEQDLEDWKADTLGALDVWKTETESSIEGWESATLAALTAWQTAAETAFEAIRVQAAASATAAAGSATAAQTAQTAAEAAKTAAETAAASVTASAAQIATNTTDISSLRAAIMVGNYDASLISDIAANTDLNTVMTPGTYRVLNNATAASLTNAPSNITPGKMIVIATTANSRIIQFYLGLGGRLWKRAFDGSTWIQWGMLLTDYQIESLITTALADIEAEISDLESQVYDLDGSLLVPGAAAESTSVREHLPDCTIYSADPVNANMPMSGTGGGGGVSWTRNNSTSNAITIAGTNNGTAIYSISALGASNTRPLITGASGETVDFKVKLHTNDTSGNAKLQILAYIPGGNETYNMDCNNDEITVHAPANMTAILFRYQVPIGGTLASGTQLGFTITVVVPHYLYSTGDNTNIYRRIHRRLTQAHRCILGVGTFYSGTTISMEAGDVLAGVGSELSTLIYTGAANAIEAAYGCTIETLGLKGTAVDIEISSDTGKNGIYVTGESSDALEGLRIRNCLLSSFGGSAIKALNTGYPTRGFMLDSCRIRNCWAGINLDQKTEYWKISNVISTGCYYGIIDNGGNNLISNSGFDSNTVGMWIDDVSGSHSNNTHGSISNCSFNHNTQAALVTTGTGANLLESGMVFTGCQFWFSGLNIDHAYGFSFCDCNFGTTTPVTINASQSIIFANCLFRTASDSPFTITNSSGNVIKRFNCYTRYGNLLSEDPAA